MGGEKKETVGREEQATQEAQKNEMEPLGS